MKISFILFFLSLGLQQAFSQNGINTNLNSSDETDPEYNYSILTTWLTFSNFGNPETNTHHYELRFAYQLSPRDQIGVKFATWKLFAPLGIDIWDSNFLDREYFYAGRLKETGVGVTYQRKLWKGLFATLEVLPLITTYIDEMGDDVGKGFKIYNSYHIGYHIPLWKKGRFFIEPQLHANHWPINNSVHENFKGKDAQWDNWFFIEPNLYLGVKF